MRPAPKSVRFSKPIEFLGGGLARIRRCGHTCYAVIPDVKAARSSVPVRGIPAKGSRAASFRVSLPTDALPVGTTHLLVPEVA